jgi:hypothetical protein
MAEYLLKNLAMFASQLRKPLNEISYRGTHLSSGAGLLSFLSPSGGFAAFSSAGNALSILIIMFRLQFV